MVYYPLSTLVMAGVRDILVITTPEDRSQFECLLGDGSQWGLKLQYLSQERPEGIAQSLIIGADFIGEESVALVLGDNIFHGMGLGRQLAVTGEPVGGRIFAYPVVNPEAYGVVEFNANGTVLSIEEKPTHPRSRYVIPGLYFYDNRAVDIAEKLVPSPRGELEISAVNETYREMGELSVTVLDRGTAWLDAGTFISLMQASEFIRVVEERQGMKIGCIEEVAWRAGLISDIQLRTLAEPLVRSGYGEYLLGLLADRRSERVPW